jgi:paraquat-inducible protein B
MTDTPQDPEEPKKPDIPEIPSAVVVPKRRWAISLVWLVPMVVALIGGWIAYNAIRDRGPTITINFKTGEGIEAGKTRIKYKNVDIGLVKSAILSGDRSHVIVKAELSTQAKNFLVADTRFWVVRPRVAGGSISGLTTLLSGSYIGVDAGKSQQEKDEFVGLDVPPVVTADLPGREFVLNAENMGSLDIGSPVFFRRVEVGQLVAFEIDKEGKAVRVRIFINAPYDKFVTENTRFWHASGIDITLDSSGLRLDTESLITIVIGGIAFQSPADEPVGLPAKAGAVFALANDRTRAMQRPDKVAENYVLLFNESVRGLAPGAQVDFRGVVIGEVISIGVDFDRVQRAFRIPVEIRLYPDRLRSRYRSQGEENQSIDRKVLFDRLVERGFRAQLRTGNLLTGQLYVALDFFPNAPKATIDWEKQPPQIPTVQGSLAELQITLAELAKKLDKVPVEAIGRDLQSALQELKRTMQSTDKLVKRFDTEIAPEALTTLQEARKALANAERALAADAPLQQDARETLRQLMRAAESLRNLTDYLERHPESLLRGKKADQQ